MARKRTIEHKTGAKLPDSDRFRSALDTAGAPDEYTSLAWVDVGDAFDALQGYNASTGKYQYLRDDAGRSLSVQRP